MQKNTQKDALLPVLAAEPRQKSIEGLAKSAALTRKMVPRLVPGLVPGACGRDTYFTKCKEGPGFSSTVAIQRCGTYVHRATLHNPLPRLCSRKTVGGEKCSCSMSVDRRGKTYPKEWQARCTERGGGSFPTPTRICLIKGRKGELSNSRLSVSEKGVGEVFLGGFVFLDTARFSVFHPRHFTKRFSPSTGKHTGS